MTIKKHIPNLLTLSNLLCGTIAVIFAVKEDFISVAILVLLGISFDFLDGLVARILGLSGELGKQLDSLADMVTSGVVPGIVIYSLLGGNRQKIATDFIEINSYLPYIGLLLTLSACYRLANFNIDTRQRDFFIGLPTPAMALFVTSLPLIYTYSDNHFFVELTQNNYFLIAVTIILSYLMNAKIPLFSLKFEGYSFKENRLKYLFLTVSILLLIILQFIAIPLVIILYVLFSVAISVRNSKIGIFNS